MLPWRRTKERERKKKVGPRRAEESRKLATPPLPHPTTTTTTCLCLLKFEGLLIGASSLKTHLFGTFCKVLCGIMKNSGAVTGSVTSRLNRGFRQRCWACGLRVLMLLLNVFCFLGKFFTSTTQIPNRVFDGVGDCTQEKRKNPETPRGLNWIPKHLKSTSAAPLNSYAASLIRAENTLGCKRDSDTTHYRTDERIVAPHNVSQKALWGIYPSVGSIHHHSSPAPTLPSESAC